MRHLRFVLVLTVLFATGARVEAQLDVDGKLSAIQITGVDSVFADVTEWSGPGYAVGIIRNEQLVFAKGYGYANLDHLIPISPLSVFDIASLSKQFTAAAIAVLVVDGRVSLDDLLIDQLPSTPEAYGSVTVGHLVYMTSGIPEYYRQERPNGRNWSGDYFEIADAVSASLSQPPEYFPGSQWSYSNVNYMLLAQIVERLAGESFGSFVQRRIFDPLGMSNTHVNDDVTKIVLGRATGYNLREGGGFHQHPRTSPHYGGSGVFSTIQDLARWDRSFYTHELGGRALTQLLLSTKTFQHDKGNDAFGLVWGEYRGRQMLWYEGGDTGFSSYMARFPDDRLSVIVLSNFGTGRAADRARAVMALLISE